MPIARQRTVSPIAQPVDTSASKLGNSISSVLGAVSSIAQSQGVSQRANLRDREMVERQGFRQTLAELDAQHRGEDGVLNQEAFGTAVQGFRGLTDMNTAMFLSDGAFQLSQERAKVIGVNEEDDRIRATATAGVLYQDLRDSIKEARDDPDFDPDSFDLSKHVGQFTDNAEVDKQFGEVGRIYFKKLMTAASVGIYDEISIDENYEKQNQVLNASTRVMRDMLTLGTPQVGAGGALVSFKPATIDDFERARKHQVEVLKEIGASQGEIGEWNRNTVQSLLDLSRDRRNPGMLDLVARYNDSLPERDQLTIMKDGSTVSGYVARTHRGIKADRTTASVGAFTKSFNHADSMAEFWAASDAFDKTGRAELSSEIVADIDQQRGEKFKVLLDNRRKRLLGPTVDSISSASNLAQVRADEERLAVLEEEKIRNLDGETVPLYGPEMLEKVRRDLINARNRLETSTKADATVAENIRAGTRIKIDASEGSAGQIAIDEKFNSLADDDGGDLTNVFISILRNQGVATDHMIDRMAQSVFPSIDPSTGNGLEEAQNGLIDLFRISSINPVMADKIAQRNPAGQMLMTLGRNGYDTEELLKRVAKKSPEDVQEALAVSRLFLNNEDGDPLVPLNFGTTIPNMNQLALYRAAYALNLLNMTSDATADDADRRKTDFNKDGRTFSDGQLLQAARMAREEALDRMEVVDVYGYKIALPKNIVNESGRQVRDAFKVEDGGVLTYQVQKIAAQSLLAQPGDDGGEGTDSRSVTETLFGVDWLYPDSRDGFTDEVKTKPGKLELFHDEESQRSYWRMPVVFETVDRGEFHLGWIEVPTSEHRRMQIMEGK